MAVRAVISEVFVMNVYRMVRLNYKKEVE